MLYQDISRLERGVRTPSWETLLKLADALSASLDDFRQQESMKLDQDEPPPAPPRRKK
jgi:transcriptional regulator with XRE-family HTH domain